MPRGGEWISAVRKNKTGKWELWVINYRSNEKQKLEEFDNQPAKTWGASAVLVCFDGDREIIIYEAGNTIRPVKSFPAPEQINKMKLPPAMSHLAIVGKASADSGAKTSLSVLNLGSGEITVLVDDFAATERQWDWLGSHLIVYASGNKLWQVELDGRHTLILSLDSPHMRN